MTLAELFSELVVKIEESQKNLITSAVIEAFERFQAQPDPEDLVTVKSIAEKYNLHQRTITNRIDARHIAKERLGHYVAVRRKYIDELLKK